jgi:phosphinothricin acetyltransferase
MSKYLIRAAQTEDGPAVVAIFNHYATSSYAAYNDRHVSGGFYARIRLGAPAYPFYVVEANGEVVGFAFLYPYHPAETLRRSATLTYFILPDHTGHGLGTQLLDRLVGDARRLGIDTLLAHISSANTGSLRFHQKHGFRQCGHFTRVGRKWHRDYDIIWVQKFLNED